MVSFPSATASSSAAHFHADLAPRCLTENINLRPVCHDRLHILQLASWVHYIDYCTMLHFVYHEIHGGSSNRKEKSQRRRMKKKRTEVSALAVSRSLIFGMIICPSILEIRIDFRYFHRIICNGRTFSSLRLRVSVGSKLDRTRASRGL